MSKNFRLLLSSFLIFTVCVCMLLTQPVAVLFAASPNDKNPQITPISITSMSPGEFTPQLGNYQNVLRTDEGLPVTITWSGDKNTVNYYIEVYNNTIKEPLYTANTNESFTTIPGDLLMLRNFQGSNESYATVVIYARPFGDNSQSLTQYPSVRALIYLNPAPAPILFPRPTPSPTSTPFPTQMPNPAPPPKYTPKPEAFFEDIIVIGNDGEYYYDDIDPADDLELPVELLKNVTDPISANEAVRSAINSLSPRLLSVPSVADMIVRFAEEAIANASTKETISTDISVSNTVINDIAKTAQTTAQMIQDTMDNAGVNTSMALKHNVRLYTKSYDQFNISIDSSVKNLDVDDIILESPKFRAAINKNKIFNDGQPEDELSFTVTDATKFSTRSNVATKQLSNAKTVTVTFNKGKSNQEVTLSLPALAGDKKTQAIVDSKNKTHPSKYDPNTGMMKTKITADGKYTVNRKSVDFTDIANKSKEMQDAIRTLSTQGVTTGKTSQAFSPDDPISRAEVAAIILRGINKLSPNENGKFKDVSINNWFFGVAGSAKKYGIINGFTDNTFRGNTLIQRTQIVSITARTLRNERKVKEASISELSKYTDMSQIPNWARADIALATKENLVIRRTDGSFNGNVQMTRGDCAIILYRLFKRI